jgi:hypothetical protein
MWHMSDWHVLSMIMVWTKYVEPMFPDIRETDLITDTWRRLFPDIRETDLITDTWRRLFPDIRETDLITDTWRRFLQIS